MEIYKKNITFKVLEQSASVSAISTRLLSPLLAKTMAKFKNDIVIRMIIGNGSIFNAIAKAKVALSIHPIFASEDDQRKKEGWFWSEPQ